MPYEVNSPFPNEDHGLHAVAAMEEILAFAKRPLNLAQGLKRIEHDTYHVRNPRFVAI